MFKRIFYSLVCLSLLTGAIFSLLVMFNYSASTEKEMYGQLQNEALMLSSLSKDDIISLGSKMLQNRITYIDKSGVVLFDNNADEEKMESHSTRPEIVMAQENGVGYSKRYSSSMNVNFLYYAVLLQNGDVLRLSTTITGVASLLHSNLFLIIISLLIVIAFTFLIALFVSKKIVKPINNIDLTDFKDFKYYSELSPLISRIKQQQRDIKEQALEKAKLDKEFFEVLDNIREGLIIIDGNHKVININKSALNIFNADFNTILNRHYLSLSRDKALNWLVEGEENVVTYSANGKYYRASRSSIPESDKKIIILWDITDKYLSEQIRTEFTANVSHELKTPITVIRGYAELIQSNICKREDELEFIEKIKEEADRLVTLVNDIINLSELDEKRNFEKTDVHILKTINNVTELLQIVAAKRDIKLNIECDDFVTFANEKLLFELIYNLVDNAIKYNVDSGSVFVRSEVKEGKNCLIIKDTGIGIPMEDKERIFERFYRVDKSRSKEKGGTGLGLSIVKHIAAINDIDIKLDSSINKGTTFTLTFEN